MGNLLKSTFTDEQRQRLALSPPKQEIRTRRSDDGAELSYVEGRYIAQTLNDLFGPEGWSRRFCGAGLRIVDQHVLEAPGKKPRYVVTALCEYRLDVGLQTHHEDVGVGRSEAVTDLAEAMEIALKAAVTDALKRCARTLGAALGSCLYDKAWLYQQRSSAPSEGHPGQNNPMGNWQHLQEKLPVKTPAAKKPRKKKPGKGAKA